MALLVAGCAGTQRAAFCRGEPDLDLWTTTLDGFVAPLVRAPGADGFADWSPDGTRIAFVSSRDGNCEIYVAKSDGTGQRNLTQSSADELYPSWSPDGSQVVFTAGGQIRILDLSSGDIAELPESDLMHSYPDWSPDGKSIAFSGGRQEPGPGAVNQIYVMAANGGEEVPLTDGESLLTAPQWSPDGRTIAYFDHGDPFIILITTTDGAETSIRYEGGHPSWSPDGSSLVYERDRGGGDVDIYLDRDVLVDGPGIETLPAWSPTGATIVFSSDRP